MIENTSNQRLVRTVSLLIFFALFIAGASFHHAVDYDNTSSRYFLVSAIVDHGTFSIDADHSETIDKSFYNGRYYSNKAIGAPFLGVPVYWMLRHLPGLKDSPRILPAAKYIIRVVTTTLPFAILGVVMFRLALVAGALPMKALLMVIGYAFGTISLLHATMFSGHQIAASLAFFSFAMVFTQRENTEEETCQSTKFFIAGLFSGFAAITDFIAIIIVFFLTIYVLSIKPSIRNILLFILGGLICAAILAAYNFACFGDTMALSYSYMPVVRFSDGPSASLVQFDTPTVKVLATTLFSPRRGLLTIMPIMLLSLIGLGNMFVRKQYRREACLIMAICTAYLIFNSGCYDGCAGWTFGPRYLVPMLPFLAFTIAFGRWNSFSFLLLFLLSLFQVLPSVAGLPHCPEDILNPLLEIIIPCMAQGYLAQNAGMLLKLRGLLSLIPIVVVVGMMVFCALRKVQSLPNGQPESPRDLSSFAMYAWLVVVICMLAFTRTTPEKLIHAYRWRLLCHAAWITKSPELIQAYKREAILADEPVK